MVTGESFSKGVRENYDISAFKMKQEWKGIEDRLWTIPQKSNRKQRKRQFMEIKKFKFYLFFDGKHKYKSICLWE